MRFLIASMLCFGPISLAKVRPDSKHRNVRQTRLDSDDWATCQGSNPVKAGKQNKPSVLILKQKNWTDFVICSKANRGVIWNHDQTRNNESDRAVTQPASFNVRPIKGVWLWHLVEQSCRRARDHLIVLAWFNGTGPIHRVMVTKTNWNY